MANLSVVAKPYAKAAFEFANENNLLEEWSVLLDGFAEFVESQAAEKIIDSPLLSQSEIIESIKDLVDYKFYNFVALIAENKKLDILPSVAGQFKSIKDAYDNTCVAQVVLASKSDKKTLNDLRINLENRFKSSIILNVSIDPSLVGGAIVKVGDTVIDSSISGRLEKLKNILLS